MRKRSCIAVHDFRILLLQFPLIREDRGDMLVAVIELVSELLLGYNIGYGIRVQDTYGFGVQVRSLIMVVSDKQEKQKARRKKAVYKINKI